MNSIETQTLRARRSRRLRGAATLCGIAAAMLPAVAGANYVPFQVYDARSAAMAGTGVAFSDSGAASYHNPANMVAVGEWAATLSLSPYFNKIHAPLPTATGGAVQQDGNTLIAPLFQIGTGYRVNEWLVVGANAFIKAGLGDKYDAVPALGNTPFSAQLVVAEVQLPVAVRLTDSLSFGLAYRVSYATVQIEGSNPFTPPGGQTQFIAFQESASGTNFGGVQAGLNFHPIPELQIGVNYRNGVHYDMSGGTIKAAGMTMPVPPNTDLRMPNEVEAGVATSLLDHKLRLAAEFRYFAYRAAPSFLTAGFRDSWTMAFGAEYFVTDVLPVRIGYSKSQGATSNEAATFYGVPPGFPQAFTAGTGLRFGNWGADAALAYTFYDTDVGPSPGVIPGQYGLRSFEVFLSGTYRL